ncbi:hypothetical protein DPMN_021452 [Dreissena polymorpha]|uniref:Uncharacterized protein n=1 Tax=Dreissena polymorpha TaxID=45954 RepID=A0A9D4NMR4_DREPO|nr:hypothetical protein DPMN_021452 [Dreissena polymorpha]
MERRETYLWRENMMRVSYQYIGSDLESFHFGSQSEGTTIPGLQSDIDWLSSYNEVNIIRVWVD